MKLSIKEYDAMQSKWRKWVNRELEIKGFKAWGMDFAGKDVLEVGCGSGYSASQICSENPKSYTGIDIMPEQLTLAEARSLTNARWPHQGRSPALCGHFGPCFLQSLERVFRILTPSSLRIREGVFYHRRVSES